MGAGSASSAIGCVGDRTGRDDVYSRRAGTALKLFAARLGLLDDFRAQLHYPYGKTVLLQFLAGSRCVEVIVEQPND